jgi:hypothetical protein
VSARLTDYGRMVTLRNMLSRLETVQSELHALADLAADVSVPPAVYVVGTDDEELHDVTFYGLAHGMAGTLFAWECALAEHEALAKEAA